MNQPSWPIAEFDPVRRLRVLAAAAPGATIHERVLAARLEQVWAVAADLEGELAQWLFPDIRTVRLTYPTEPEQAVATVIGYSGLRARFDVVLQPGWCLMQSRFLIGGMAATPEPPYDGGTRFAFLGGFRGPLRPMALLTRPLANPAGRHALDRFTERVEQRTASHDS
ncbi:MAG: hypothetical protein M3Y35_05755 [Actinomycetota bacterium]|nr:hypothetical protein [Actinomycetota bacterium]